MIEVFTDKAPTPTGHRAQGIVHQGLVYVSGQLAVDPQTGEKRLGSIEEQTLQALENVAAILEAAGSSIDRVVISTDASGRPASATIYDYKTDAVDSRYTLANLTRHYSRQLLAYRDALAAISRIPAERIQMVLVYTDTGTLQVLKG